MGSHISTTQHHLMLMSLAALLLLTGCASQPQIASTEPAPVWPAAPEAPRIAYVQSFSKPEDLGISKGIFTKVYEFIVGASDHQ